MDTVIAAVGPDRAWTRVRAQASWVPMWGLASVLAIVAVVLRAPIAESNALSLLPAGLSPERVEAIHRMMMWSLWVGVGAAPLMLLVKYAFWAALVLMLTMCVGAHTSYRRAFAVVACASVVLGVDAALTAVMLRLGGTSMSGLPQTALSLAHAVDLSAWPLARVVADEVGLFSLLYWWAVGAGAVKALGLTRVQAALVVSLLWFVRIAIVVMVTAIASIARAGLV